MFSDALYIDAELAGPTNDAPIWVCFLCTKQFSHQDLLMEHQEECEKEAEVREAKQRMLAIRRQREALSKSAMSQVVLTVYWSSCEKLDSRENE